MTTESFVETRKKHGFVFETSVTVEREPASVLYLNRKSRWFQTVGDSIVSVEKVKVTRNSVKHPSSNPYVEQGFEVTFACGARGYIVERSDGSAELDALMVGTTPYLHGLAVWPKHGSIVGAPVPWLLAQRTKRGRASANTAKRCCAAELYARAEGKPWGEPLNNYVDQTFAEA